MNTNVKHCLSLAIFGLALLLLLPNTAKAADCGNDPVYERDWAGQTNVGSRVRDWACMEDSEILTVLPSGTKVHIIGETDGWYKVQVGDKTGWVGMRLIDVTSKNGSDVSTITPTVKPTSAPVSLIGIDEANFSKLKAGDAGLSNRLRNMVVLRVHFHGEAYLVNEDGTLKILTAEEVKAYKLGQKIEKKAEVKLEKKAETGSALKIRKLIGIDEANFAKLEAGDSGLRQRLMDQLVLRVHAHGQAYWVNPDGGLKFLGPGEVGYYLTQNLKPDNEENKETGDDSKDETGDDSQNVSGSIALDGQLTDPGKVKLTWATTGLDASKGFKVVISESENPVYPGNSYHYLSNPSTRSDYWAKLTDGKTYHFRVCQYLGNECGVYSNDIAITVKTNGAFAENTLPGTIDLTVSPLSGGKADISWTLSDMDSPKGFKVVIDESANPVYPGNDYHYLTDPNIRTDIWTGLDSGATYHFRVCEYLGGYCGTYSNDVAITAL
ncbi:MAG: SH3 domain-containing protein [Patescibacteria group bacterium]|nr:SH3 domain-containing protein [Patescibacteria group bacterium]